MAGTGSEMDSCSVISKHSENRKKFYYFRNPDFSILNPVYTYTVPKHHTVACLLYTSIPVIMEGRDLIGCAQTGTGKTAAYTLPLLERLLREGNPDNVVKSLIVVPTRELAQQIDVQFQGFSYFLPLSTTVVYGGGDGFGWSEQKQGMLMGCLLYTSRCV